MPEIPSVDAIVRVGVYLFDQFCESSRVPLPQRHTVKPQQFMRWLGNITALNQLTSLGLAAAAACSVETADCWLRLLENPMGINSLVGLWPHLVLTERVNAHPIRSVTLNAVITFVDGSVAPIQMLVHKDVCDAELDDAHITQLIVTKAPELAQRIYDCSLDKMHDMYSKHFGGIATDAVFQHLKDLVVADTTQDNDLRDASVKILDLVMSFFPTELPPVVVEAFKQQAAKQGSNG